MGEESGPLRDLFKCQPSFAYLDGSPCLVGVHSVTAFETPDANGCVGSDFPDREWGVGGREGIGGGTSGEVSEL